MVQKREKLKLRLFKVESEFFHSFFYSALDKAKGRKHGDIEALDFYDESGRF
jgi:hypothetical protein